MEINTDNLVVDGNNHIIDGSKACVPFIINAGNITLKNIIFKDFWGSEDSGVFIVGQNASLKIINCEFTGNKGSSAGVIDNYGNLEILDSRFVENEGGTGGCIFNDNSASITHSFFESNKSNNAGAIHNHLNGNLNIDDCTFDSNSAFPRWDLVGQQGVGSGGSIGNFGKLTVTHSKFDGNSANVDGGAIAIQDGSVSISDSKFYSNRSKCNGGAIVSLAEIEVNNSVFESNSAQENGGSCLYIDNCKLKSNSCEFRSSLRTAVVNFGNAQLKDALFDKNQDCILNESSLKIDNSEFTQNSICILNQNTLEMNLCKFAGNSSQMPLIYNDSSLKIYACDFLENRNDGNIMLNEGTLDMVESSFSSNDSDTLIYNEEESVMNLYLCKFTDNVLGTSSLYNQGAHASLTELTFDDNKSPNSIVNITDLDLEKPVIKGSDSFTVFNEGNMVVRKSDSSILSHISGDGNVELVGFDEDSSDGKKECGFFELNRLIDERLSDTIVLEDDFTLKNLELPFFEGGLEIASDGLHIDGNGHTIDAGKKSRIFHIMARGIVFENIVFKNCRLISGYDNHSNGGGALKILKDASLKLINCRFVACHSDEDGGAILNRGKMICEGNSFENCSCDLFGGAIYNHGHLTSSFDFFKDANSKIATIFNEGNLTITSDDFSNCTSLCLSQEIFNIGELHTNSPQGILNYANVNFEKINDAISFSELDRLIKDAGEELILTIDISYDYARDKNLSGPILIEKSITIDGKGNTIDARSSSSFFEIKDGLTVVFKNLTFKNGYSDDESLIRIHSKVTFEDCKFIKNRLINDASMINAYRQVEAIDCNFISNLSNLKPLIINNNDFKCVNCNFINNHSQNSSVVENTIKSHFIFEKSYLVHNYSDSFSHPVLVNEGRMDFMQSSCSFNKSNVPGGVINNRMPSNVANPNVTLIIFESEFVQNRSNVFAGVLANGSRTNAFIKKSKFLKNEAMTDNGASVIDNYPDGYLEISQSKFIENTTKKSKVNYIEKNKNFNIGFEEGTITSYKDECKIEDCEFIGND